MIEQALAMAEGQGEEDTVQIATQLGVDGQILVDGNQVNITVEQVSLPGTYISIATLHTTNPHYHTLRGFLLSLFIFTDRGHDHNLNAIFFTNYR